MKTKLTILLLLTFIFEMSSQDKNLVSDSMYLQAQKIKQANVEAASKQTITHFVMKNVDGTFGYSIFIDGNMTYHQSIIPAVSGNKGFVKVQHADAVAKLVIQKLKEGESPPTVSVEEVNAIIE